MTISKAKRMYQASMYLPSMSQAWSDVKRPTVESAANAHAWVSNASRMIVPFHIWSITKLRDSCAASA